MIDLRDAFYRDVNNRASQKLASFIKESEEESDEVPFGQEPEFKHTLWESIANSAPVSGLLDITYGSGLGNILEKIHDTDYKELGKSLYDKSGLSTAADKVKDIISNTYNYTGELLGEGLNKIVPDFKNSNAINNQKSILEYYNTPKFHAQRKRNKKLGKNTYLDLRGDF